MVVFNFDNITDLLYFWSNKFNRSDLKNFLTPDDWTVEHIHTLCTLQ